MLYKYLPIDASFDSSKNPGSLSVIRDRTLKYTSPSDFNDPFDCQPDIDFNRLFSSILEQEPVTPLERLSGADPIKGMDGKWVSQYVGAFGICCFSRNPKNILMWSHYASNHRGFVAEFQPDYNLVFRNLDPSSYNQCVKENLHAQDVRYQIIKPKITYIKREGLDFDFESKLLFTKAPDWSYEEESRVVLMPGIQHGSFQTVHGVHGYKNSLLKSVIIGLNCSKQHAKLIADEIGLINSGFNLDVKIKRVTKMQQRFALEITEL